ncbi:MAG: hypothetical protein JW863_06230 [Chitinispirillaceae bacterium]|nr:hypothetical protein [Chitinispirillaceae bacterium]
MFVKKSSATSFFFLLAAIPAVSFGQVEYGIAAEYPNDEGISGNPAVVFTEDFEESTIDEMHSRWSEEGEVQRGDYMTFSADVPPRSGGTQSLTAPGNDEGPGLYRRLTGNGTGYDRLFFRFYGKLDTACSEIHHYSWMGGHNPSTTWPNPRAGYRPAGDSHFSSGAEPGTDGWDFYTYWMDMGCWGSEDGECHGNCFLWNNEKPAVRMGEWYCWEMMIKVNDPPDASNGEQAFWIDGRKYAHFGPGLPTYTYSGTDRWGESDTGAPFPGFRWRTVEDLRVNYVWLYNYVHDDACRAWFDDVVVATSYIGPMVKNSYVDKSAQRQNVVSRTITIIQNAPGRLTVRHPFTDTKRSTFSVFSPAGRRIFRCTGSWNRQFTIESGLLPTGSYVGMLRSGREQLQVRFIVSGW